MIIIIIFHEREKESESYYYVILFICNFKRKLSILRKKNYPFHYGAFQKYCFEMG